MVVSEGAVEVMVSRPVVASDGAVDARVWSATPVAVSNDVAVVVVAMVWVVAAAAKVWVAAAEVKVAVVAVEVLTRAGRGLEVAAAAVCTGRSTGDP